MTKTVINFLQTNKSLLNKNLVEFFHSCRNGLSDADQSEVVEALEFAGIDTYSARKHVMMFVIGLQLEFLESKCELHRFVSHLKYGGLLGFDHSELVQCILENTSEWDIDIEFINNDYYIVPREV